MYDLSFQKVYTTFADIAYHLTPLTSKNAQFVWGDKQQTAFTALQHALLTPPFLLDYPRQDNQFVLATDASDICLGAVLSTNCSNFVEYASCTLR